MSSVSEPLAGSATVSRTATARNRPRPSGVSAASTIRMSSPVSVAARPSKRSNGWPRNLLIATAIGLALDASGANDRLLEASAAPRAPNVLAVTNCNDNGAGSLRQVIASAVSGDTIDLSQLSCTTISLTSGQIATYVSNLTIQGPGQSLLTIDGNSADEVFDFSAGNGTTTLRDLAIADGVYDGGGGCVFVDANADLARVTLSSCMSTDGGAGAMLVLGNLTMDASLVADNVTTDGDGGGVDVEGNATISNSVISGNSASQPSPFAPSGGGLSVVGYLRLTGSHVENNSVTCASAGYSARGGGVAAFSGANIIQSTISGNTVENSAVEDNARGGGLYLFGNPVNLQYTAVYDNVAGGDGGGLVITGDSIVFSSTIDHNSGRNNSALVLGSYVAGQTADIVDSTISGNRSSASSAVFASLPLAVYSSTIAFNTAAGTSAGLYLYPGGDADIESTIIANNASDGGTGFDLVARAAVTGSHDLIEVPATAVPPDTIVATDPMLSALADNGGPTRTHALMPGSPAIDAGSNPYDAMYDQRGSPYLRVFGSGADIGAYEVQTSADDTIFENGFE